MLKEKIVIVSLLVFLHWKKEFHVHGNASCIAIGAVFTPLREGDIDHPIEFYSRKLSKAKMNYSTLEHARLAMVYTLKMFQHYLLGAHFKMYIHSSALKYLVNKLVLGWGICMTLN